MRDPKTIQQQEAVQVARSAWNDRITTGFAACVLVQDLGYSSGQAWDFLANKFREWINPELAPVTDPAVYRVQ